MERCPEHDLLNCKCREPFADYIARRDRESDDVRVVGVVRDGRRDGRGPGRDFRALADRHWARSDDGGQG